MVEKIKKDIKKKGGFTLAELLIVVAIIAVLVAIAIPVFTDQLEKSRAAADAANIRAAYAELTADYLADGSKLSKSKISVKMNHKNSSTVINVNSAIKGVGSIKGSTVAQAKVKGNVTLSIDKSTGKVTIK